MRLRAVFFDGIMVLLWAFLAFIYLGVIGFNILLVGLGIVFGFARWGQVLFMIKHDIVAVLNWLGWRSAWNLKS